MSETGRVQERRRGRHERGFTLVEVLTVTVIIGMLIAIAIPSIQRARVTSQGRSCAQNLRVIESAKDQYLMDRNLPRTTTVVSTDIAGAGLYIRTMPDCPGQGTYTVGSGITDATCDIGGMHSLQPN